MKALLFNPHYRSCRPLVRILEHSAIFVDSTSDWKHCCALAKTGQYVAVLYIHGGDEISLLTHHEQWRVLNQPALFIVISRNTTERCRQELVDKGIEHIFVEPYSPTHIIALIAMYGYHSGNQAYSTYQNAVFEVDILARSAWCADAPLELTRTEFDLLSLFIRKPNVVLSRPQIWEEVWGHKEYPLANTIDVHVNRLRKKLGSYQRVLRTVHGIGYCLQDKA